MRDVFIAGTGMTAFGKFMEISIRGTSCLDREPPSECSIVRVASGVILRMTWYV